MTASGKINRFYPAEKKKSVPKTPQKHGFMDYKPYFYMTSY